MATSTALLVTVAVFVLTQRHVTTRVTKDDTLRRFRSAHTQDGLLAQTPTPTTSTSMVLTDGPPPSAPTHAANERSTSAVAAPHQPVGSATPPYDRPHEGVYTYRTTGGESISLAGASHTYPSETYATVHHLAGCQWQDEFDVLKEHVEKRTACSEPGRLLDVETVRSITFFGQTETEDLRCDPPIIDHETDESRGTTLRGTCRSSDASAGIASTFVARETMPVAGVAVEAIHLSFHAAISGRAHGTADEQMWVLASTGLILRWDRANEADANAAFGATIHYHEQATFVLESLTPST